MQWIKKHTMALTRLATGSRSEIAHPPELLEAVKQSMVFWEVTGTSMIDTFRVPKESLTAKLRTMVLRTEGLRGTQDRWSLIDARFTERVLAELPTLRTLTRRVARTSKRPLPLAFMEVAVFVGMIAFELADGRVLPEDLSDFVISLFHILRKFLLDSDFRGRPSLADTIEVWRRQRDLLRTVRSE